MALECTVMISRAVPALRHESCPPGPEDTPSACWCRRTSARASTCWWRARRSGGKLVATNIPAAATPVRDGSIIIVVATDAPLIAHQLKRLARRAALGIARTGGMSGNGSGDIFIAFSTANPGAAEESNAASLSMLSNRRVDDLFEATVFATEEAVINAMVAAETMIGRDYHQTVALPHEELKQALRKYGRLVETK